MFASLPLIVSALGAATVRLIGSGRLLGRSYEIDGAWDAGSRSGSGSDSDADADFGDGGIGGFGEGGGECDRESGIGGFREGEGDGEIEGFGAGEGEIEDSGGGGGEDGCDSEIEGFGGGEGGDGDSLGPCGGDRRAVVECGTSGSRASVTILERGVPFLSVSDTDVEHAALALAESMRSTETLSVEYRCNDETRRLIEGLIADMCDVSS